MLSGPPSGGPLVPERASVEHDEGVQGPSHDTPADLGSQAEGRELKKREAMQQSRQLTTVLKGGRKGDMGGKCRLAVWTMALANPSLLLVAAMGRLSSV